MAILQLLESQKCFVISLSMFKSIRISDGTDAKHHYFNCEKIGGGQCINDVWTK